MLGGTTMSSQPGKSNTRVESAIERIRELNDRIVKSAKLGGEESIRTYERMLENLAEAQEAAGDRSSDWIREFAHAQANFTRQLAEAFPALLQRLGARGKEIGTEIGGEATDRARDVPGVPDAEGLVRGAVARAEDLPIENYDELTVQEINRRLGGLSEVELATVAAYEGRTKNRKTIQAKIDALRH
jgi:polyhydroxyalkanoate synthesis regulator phasin